MKQEMFQWTDMQPNNLLPKFSQNQSLTPDEQMASKATDSRHLQNIQGARDHWLAE